MSHPNKRAKMYLFSVLFIKYSKFMQVEETELFFLLFRGLCLCNITKTAVVNSRKL